MTRVEVEVGVASPDDVDQAGGTSVPEPWVPAEELETVDDHLVGLIKVVAEICRPDASGVDATRVRTIFTFSTD